jgi:hypothetical protein
MMCVMMVMDLSNEKFHRVYIYNISKKKLQADGTLSQIRKLFPPTLTNKIRVKSFQVAKPGEMKHHQQRQHFRIPHCAWFT